MVTLHTMEVPLYSHRSFLQHTANDTISSRNSSNSTIFRYRDKDYSSASAALQAYIDNYEGKSSQKPSDKNIRDLLCPDALISHRNSPVYNSYNDRLKMEISADKLAEIRKDMESSFVKLLRENHKRQQVNDAMTESSRVLSKVTMDNLSSLGESPPQGSESLESMTTDMLISAKPIPEPKRGHIYSYHTKNRSSSLTRADTTLRRSHLDSRNLELKAQSLSRSTTKLPTHQSHPLSADRISPSLRSKLTKCDLSKIVKDNDKTARTDVCDSANSSIKWSPNKKGLITSTPQHKVKHSSMIQNNSIMKQRTPRLSTFNHKKPTVCFESSSSDISTRGRAPPSWVSDVEASSDTTSVVTATGRKVPTWINDIDHSEVDRIMNHNSTREPPRHIFTQFHQSNRTDGAKNSMSDNLEVFMERNLKRSTSFEDLAIGHSKLDIRNKPVLSNKDEKEDSILLHVKQLLESSSTVNDDSFQKPEALSPSTDTILDGDRPWEKPLRNLHPTLLQHTREDHVLGRVTDALENEVHSPRLTGRDQPGSMEALKNMLFTMQDVASKSGASTAENDVSQSQNYAQARSSAEEYNGLEPQTREMLDDSYIRNEGGESLHRALVHLSRLKTLVQSDPVSQLNKVTKQNL